MKQLLFFLSIVLLTQCTQNRNLNSNQQTSIQVTSEQINDEFGGVGFHVYFHNRKPSKWRYEQVFAKRWRELNPSFARVNDSPQWDEKEMDTAAYYLDVMKNTNTEIYLTSFGVRSIYDYPTEKDYVKKETDNIEYLVREKGFDNIKNYCMTNELSVDYWASMVREDQLDRFKRIHQLFYDELNNRDLDIKLLATDASPFVYWPTIEWAAENMDDITGVYGGHHYINSYHLDDLSFYSFFLDKMKWGAGLAESKGKNFIMGEFGPKQGSFYVDTVFYDGMIYNYTPQAPYVGIQLSEAIIAQINGGIYASCYWTFSDIPGIPPSDQFGYRANRWGVFKWFLDDQTTKPNYYSVGLMTKFFRGPSEVYKVTTTDTLLRVCAIKNLENDAYSVAIVNRNREPQNINLDIEGLPDGTQLRKYIYDPEDVPFNYFGDLQDYTKKVELVDGRFSDEIPAYSLIVYTGNYDEDPPAAVSGLKVEMKKVDRYNANVLTWDPNQEEDLCYYRIYRSVNKDVEIIPRNETGTTIASEFVDKRIRDLPQFYYRIVAVDKSGNTSE